MLKLGFFSQATQPLENGNKVGFVVAFVECI